MKADPAPPNHDPRHAASGQAVRWVPVAGVLLLALVARVHYAYDLPLTGDETSHLQVARQISLRPDTFNLPLDSPATSHPLGVVYLTALADWVGGGNVLVIRLAFVALSLIGLIGLYVLAASLFGPRVALIALALGAADRHLAAQAPVFLESPAVTVLAPWAMLLMHRCVVRRGGADWLLLGVLVGLGYWMSAVFLAFLAALGLYILLMGRLTPVLKSPWMYAGVAVMLAVMSPLLISDLTGGGHNYARNVDKLGTVGLSPRAALLYAGDLLICLKDPTWIVQNGGGRMYLPVYVTCNWVTGLVYLALTLASLRFWRDERILLLLAVVAGFLIPVTLIDAREPWNEFTWASSTLFAAILLTAAAMDRMLTASAMDRMLSVWWGKIVVSTFLAYTAGALLWFLAGPKWGYYCPNWERAYVGQVGAIRYRPRWNPERFAVDRAAGEIRVLTDRAIARRPESAVAWYHRGLFAPDAAQRVEAFERALQIDPNNPLVVEAQARDLTATGNWAGVRSLLQGLIADGQESFSVRLMLAEAAYRLRNFTSAVSHADRALVLKPEEIHPYLTLYFIYDAMGDRDRAQAARNVYVGKNAFGPVAAYLALAKEHLEQARLDKGRTMLEAAIRSRPRQASEHALIGSLLVHRLNDVDRGIEHFQAAAQLGSSDPDVYYNLAVAMERNRDYGRAIGYYEKVIELAPDDADAHVRLGRLLAEE